ncbi:MAG TPA: ABC transporter ATP-binding protein [Stellaceae bacterium]|nr:ABC transporter ATP-binding protein [Stellaceae bacterium]
MTAGSAAAPRARIAFDHVSVAFASARGTMRVVDDVSYEIRDREFVAVIGPSGCGKTTMMNIVAGFMQPTAGRVLLDGRPVPGPGPDRGVMFQEYGVFPWLSVRDNIAFGLTLRANRVTGAERREIVDRYMRLMGLAEFADAWPKTLSGGMRQRLALARAYAVRPEFLLMDEPFGALDAQLKLLIEAELMRLWQAARQTILYVTHDLHEAIVMADWVVVFSARPARIRAIQPIDIPRPRDLTDTRFLPKFRELHETLWELLRPETNHPGAAA